MSKTGDLLKLAQKRQATIPTKLHGWSRDYGRFGDYRRDCDYVSPYSLDAHNHDALIMVMLQDLSSDDKLRNSEDQQSKNPDGPHGHDPAIPTNINLKKLLCQTFDIELKDTWATNLFPFIKMGGMSAKIPQCDMIKAAREFALPQVEIIKPKLVICLGKDTFNAMRAACNLSRTKNCDEAIRSPFDFGSSRIWCQAHTGILGQMNRKRGNPDDVIESDWHRMRKDIECKS